MISLFMEHLQLISCGISVIMGRTAVTTGQPGQNGHTRAGAKG